MKRLILILLIGNVFVLILLSSKTKVINYLDITKSHDVVRPFCIDNQIPIYKDLDYETKALLSRINRMLNYNSRLVVVISPKIYYKNEEYYSSKVVSKIRRELRQKGTSNDRIFGTPANVDFMDVCPNPYYINCHLMVCDYEFYLKHQKAV